MIQILGLRDNPVNPKAKMEVFFERNWRFTTADEVFTSTEKLLTTVPESEHYNLYFTVADCFEERGRKLKEQYLIPFDIDNIGLPDDTQEIMEAKAKLVAEISCGAIGLEYSKTAVVFSGNGVQFFAKIQRPIIDEDFFDEQREHYAAICEKIRFKLLEKGLAGEVDTTVFCKGRLMRLPLTENRKKNKPTRIAKVLQSTLEAIDFDIKAFSGINEFTKHESLSPQSLAKYPKPDTAGVLGGCGFIQHCFANAKTLKEFEWYAGVSVVSRLDDGEKLCHAMSEPYADYSYYETQQKVEQSLKSSGPRTCKNISTFFEGCKRCPHNGKVASPILICSENYIKSKDNGYRVVTLDANGVPKAGRPAYEDIIRQFRKDYYYIVLQDNEEIDIFNGVYWEAMAELKIKEWLTKLVKPAPSVAEMNEAIGRIRAHNVKDREWFTESAHNKMNFKNGTLDLGTGILSTHSPEHGFTYVLPYAYDPTAPSPVWDRFMKEVSCGDAELVQMLEEFAGYTLYGGDCVAQIALILLGEGRNGKSVFAETVGEIVGQKNFSTLMVHQLADEQMRGELVHKLFNYSDESSMHSLKGNATAELKQLITGGYTQVKVVFEKPYKYRNKAKFMMLANDLPVNTDTSEGFFRRFAIARFDRQFTDTDDNKFLRIELRNELAGICNTLVKAFRRLQVRNYVFIQPESSKRELLEYRESSNPLLQFLAETAIVPAAATKFLNVPTLYSSEYEIWARLSNEKPVSKKEFTRGLRRAFPRTTAGQVKIDGKNVRGLFGIALENSTEGEF